jgi:hypothetical protein
MEEDGININGGDFTQSENEILHQDPWVTPRWPYAHTSHLNMEVNRRDKQHSPEYCTFYH